MKISEEIGIPPITHRDTTFKLLLLQRLEHTWLELRIAKVFQTRWFLSKLTGNLIAQVMENQYHYSIY